MNGEEDLVSKRVTKSREGDAVKELQRTIRGQMNRLTRSNLPSISRLISDLYQKNSLFQVNECVCESIHHLVIVDPALSPLKLISELALLLATLQANVGDEVAGHAVHFFVSMFHRLRRERMESKERERMESKKIDNLLLFFCHLYAASVFDSTLILDLMNQLLEDFDEKSVELLLNMLISVGFILRKNSPCQMKELIQRVNIRACEAQSVSGTSSNSGRTSSGSEESQSAIRTNPVSEESQSTIRTNPVSEESQSTIRTNPVSEESQSAVRSKRIEFMLGTLAEIRNNNIMKVTSKCSGVILPIDREEVKTVLRNCLKKGNKVTPLPVRYSQALSSNRWWVKVGSLKEREGEGKEREGSSQLIQKRRESSQLIQGESSQSTLESAEEELCRKLRLNTSGVRRSLFKAVISSADIVEASSRVISISLRESKSVKESRDPVHVILQLALHESPFNPFYTHLLSRLSHFDRRFKLSTHFALMDRIQSVESMGEGMKKRLIHTILHLLEMKVISLSVLQGIQFSDLTEPLVLFVKSVLSAVMHLEDSLMKQIFHRIPNKDNSFATSIRLFISCFMDEKNDAVGKEIIKARIRLNQRNKLPFRPPVDQVRESSDEEVGRESSDEEVGRESSDEEVVQESSDEEVVKETRDQWSLRELEKKRKESKREDGKEKKKKQVSRKRKTESGDDGKSVVGKKCKQRNKEPCPPVDQARESSDEEVVQKRPRDQLSLKRPRDQLLEVQKRPRDQLSLKRPRDQLSLKELEKEYKESIKQEDEKERKMRKKEVARERRLLMKEENEDAVIKEMRRKLKLHKRRKTQTAIPRSFYTDGLGDLLDFIEKRNGSDGEERDEGEEERDGGKNVL